MGKMLGKTSFIIAVSGVSILLGLLIWPNYEPVRSPEELEDLEINNRVFIEGHVERERVIGESFRILGIVREGFEAVSVVCECGESYMDDGVEVRGIIEEYEGRKQVRVLEIVRAILED